MNTFNIIFFYIYLKVFQIIVFILKQFIYNSMCLLLNQYNLLVYYFNKFFTVMNFKGFYIFIV